MAVVFRGGRACSIMLRHGVARLVGGLGAELCDFPRMRGGRGQLEWDRRGGLGPYRPGLGFGEASEDADLRRATTW
jgi:hypothetical protein